ncbi:glycoside hydrolase family 127 protein [Agromyces seonyuensis]|uniref:Glycoside hydrolase family 127 protein n=1 Tax=Agromyces seonyuensis TaxID=2662446 RepID=A0A6I4P045_9MICO|nr:beta-L-arabinofuranosidase domain-containing protein [Agromyces seonyuensis]MWB98115.1 glycoside hydrolase family 127 protein [Agromyces seonyuensis]
MTSTAAAAGGLPVAPAAASGGSPVAPVVPARGVRRPLGLDEVRLTDGFWARRQEVNATGTIPHIGHWLDREGWLGNFDLAAAGRLPEGRRGREFSDSEVYKYLEAIAWEIGRQDAAGSADAAAAAADLDARFRDVVARVAAAQEPDGYLNTKFGRPGQEPRWSDLEWGHELYCLGHLFQAAVARRRTRPDADDGLVDVARRAADLVSDVFGPTGIQSVCGHAEIEVGLAELGRALDEPRYLEQAERFVERRGQGTLADIEWGRSYYQDDVPVREATVLRGHAVRANYLAAGAVDVAVDSGDDALLGALRDQWASTAARRTYVTGGQGSHHQDEAFGDDFELPSDRAYSETCAGIASIMFSERLLLADADPTEAARHADLVERTLYNVVATSPADDGRSFYYANTLHQRRPGAPADPEVVSPRAHSSLRAPWFEVSCCPPNVARTFASLAAYFATADADGVQLHQYAPARIATDLGGGRAIALAVETSYPADGLVRVRVDAAPGDAWTLGLRVPSWADGARLRVIAADGAPVEVQDAHPGQIAVARVFAVGDVVELDLPVAPRFTEPDPRTDAIRGTLAVERGPEVFALESVDLAGTALAGVDLADLVVDASVGPREADGRVVVTLRRRATAGEPMIAAEAALVPYHEWAERGPSTMRIWLPTS